MPLGSGTGRWELRQRGIKGVRVHDNSRFGGVEIDCDHIEATWTFMEVPAREIVECHPRNAALLPAGHRRRGAAEFRRHARFDFHEHKRRPVPRDDVDFAEPRAVTPLNNCVPPPLQFGTSEVFARNAEELTRIAGHVDADLQGPRRRVSTVGRRWWAGQSWPLRNGSTSRPLRMDRGKRFVENSEGDVRLLLRQHQRR